ncbi:15454_t:CDS:2 [Acaulospora morrowiae]|uniref:15454_t:CDS:1 n=1 Tax=Acaulospora morrowiae TaxID=94023 RepID=A0A9N9I274_9GLOM|nr:15454_t:CDS:2 [Acaulospora morrowiae]
MSLVSIDVILSLFWENNLKRAPREFCYFQALLLQYACYLTMACALCFAIQTYRLLVLYKQETSAYLKRLYYGFIIIYPIVITIILAILSIRFKAIKPRVMNCDVVDTPVRLIGYSGTNLILSLPGTFISGIVPNLELLLGKKSHLDQFKTTLGSRDLNMANGHLGSGSSEEMGIMSESQSDSSSSAQEDQHKKSLQPQPHLNATSRSITQPSRTKKGRNVEHNRSYNVTRRAAIRMVGFSLAFALINITASVGVVLRVLADKPNDTGLASNDWVGGFLGIIVYLVFGLPDSVFRVQNI